MSISFAKLYEKQNRSVGIAFWHIQFCTKYRFKMFSKLKYKNLIQACIKRVCFKHNIKIIVLNVLPDHIHLIAKVSVNSNPSKLLQLIKGGSSYLFFKYHPKARFRYPCGHLWSPGKFIASVGFTDLDFTISYVLHQEEHHFLSHGNQVL
jgi:putative transposase